MPYSIAKNKRESFINLEGFINPMHNRTNRKICRLTGFNYLSVAFFKSLFSCKHKYIAKDCIYHGAAFPKRTMSDVKASGLYLKLKPYLRLVKGDVSYEYPKQHKILKPANKVPFIRLRTCFGYVSNEYVTWDCSKDPIYPLEDSRELTFAEFLQHYNITIQQLPCVL